MKPIITTLSIPSIFIKAILLLSALFLASCASIKYPNWEYVRVVYKVPSDLCEYKLQEACSYSGAKCFNWFKKRATIFDANTVVITERDENVNISSGMSKWGYETHLTMMADYYSCPQSKHINNPTQTEIE